MILSWGAIALVSAYSPRSAECPALADPAVLVDCALTNSPRLAEARRDLAIAHSRQLSASAYVPSNPTLDFSLCSTAA